MLEKFIKRQLFEIIKMRQGRRYELEMRKVSPDGKHEAAIGSFCGFPLGVVGWDLIVENKTLVSKALSFLPTCRDLVGTRRVMGLFLSENLGRAYFRNPGLEIDDEQVTVSYEVVDRGFVSKQTHTYRFEELFRRENLPLIGDRI